MKIVNLFCDASIDINNKIACGGCYVTLQELNRTSTYTNGLSVIGMYNLDEVNEYCSKMYIQHDATNNSAEILAIWSGITEILRIRNDYPYAVFRLFSDSKISLYGLRDWMKNWINRYDPNKGTLISTSGTEVANQQYFIDIYNMIIAFDIKVEFYHQRGHVGESGGVNEAASRAHFIRANKVPPEALGLSIKEINRCNHTIDNNTRSALRAYVSNGTFLPNTELEGVRPFTHYPIYDKLDTYIHNINKVSVYSRHDFRNGYNQ